MRTRQHRLTSADAVRNHTANLQHKSVSIILNDRRVLSGMILMIAGENLEISNARGKRLSISLKDVNEVYFDTKEC